MISTYKFKYIFLFIYLDFYKVKTCKNGISHATLEFISLLAKKNISIFWKWQDYTTEKTRAFIILIAEFCASRRFERKYTQPRYPNLFSIRLW